MIAMLRKKLALMRLAVNSGYLLMVNGNNVTLTNALPRKIAGITIYGASGGVGDSDVPTGYTQLAYIESTGTQYIDTGVKLNQSSEVEMDASNTNGIMLFGSRSSATSKNFSAFKSYARVITLDFYTYDPNRLNHSLSSQTERIKLFMSEAGVTINDTSYTWTTTGNFTTPGNCYICNWSGSYPSSYTKCAMRLYHFKISQSGTPVRDFVPARRDSDEAIGLYDTVNDVFYTDAAGGNFTAGNDMYKVPIAIGSKNVTLYSSAALGPDDILTVNIQRKTATLNINGVSTDISALQDWTQDFALTEGANECSVGTTNEPADTDWQYWSGKKYASQYTMLEYIASSGSAYIDTGIKGLVDDSNNMVVSAELMPTGLTSSTSSVIGATASGTFSTVAPVMFASGQACFSLGQTLYKADGSDSDAVERATMNNGTKYNISCRCRGWASSLSVNGSITVSAGVDDVTADTGSQNLYLFAANAAAGATNFFIGRIYSCSITKNNVLVRNFVPAKDNGTGDIGMLDTANNVFYTSDGNSFTAGPAI